MYLYRTADKLGNIIDFYLSVARNTEAAKRFLGKALRDLNDWETPHTISTDKAFIKNLIIRRTYRPDVNEAS